MATRLRVRKKKQARDRISAHKKDPKPQSHKIARARSKKAKKKLYNRAE